MVAFPSAVVLGHIVARGAPWATPGRVNCFVSVKSLGKSYFFAVHRRGCDKIERHVRLRGLRRLGKSVRRRPERHGAAQIHKGGSLV